MKSSLRPLLLSHLKLPLTLAAHFALVIFFLLNPASGARPPCKKILDGESTRPQTASGETALGTEARGPKMLNEELAGSLTRNSALPFLPHIVEGDPTSFGNALALNVPYEPILVLRKLVSREIGRALDFFKGWDPSGEAHVTVITPPEYVLTLRHHISMERISQIADEEMNIQSADIKVIGIGSGNKLIEGTLEETFFVIVDSLKLRRIRHRIYDEFVANGGSPAAFDPTWFFPHITIGFTKRDLFEGDGVIKNTRHSWDQRFN